MALSQLAGLSLKGASDPTSFRAIVDNEFDYVWVTLRRLGVDARDLEDIAQQVFISVYRRLGDYDASRPLRPWLFAFALRAASDWRKQARHRVEVLARPTQVAGVGLAPDEALARNEDLDLVVQALEDIEMDRRAVFILHELEERTMREISEMLGIPLFTGYSRLRLARPPPANAAVVPSVAASNSSEALRLPSARSTRSAAVPLSENSPTSTVSRLNAERILLDAARGAIEREDGLAALAELDQHERKYSSGVLVQEREAMAIRALGMLGRTTDAMARARRFRARFPDSALLPSIDSTVQALPAP